MSGSHMPCRPRSCHCLGRESSPVKRPESAAIVGTFHESALRNGSRNQPPKSGGQVIYGRLRRIARARGESTEMYPRVEGKLGRRQGAREERHLLTFPNKVTFLPENSYFHCGSSPSCIHTNAFHPFSLSARLIWSVKLCRRVFLLIFLGSS